MNPSLPWFTQNVYCTCWYPNEPLKFWHVRTCVDGIAFGPWWDIFSRHHLLWICCSRFVDTIYIYIWQELQVWQIKNKMKQCGRLTKTCTSCNNQKITMRRERERVPALATFFLHNTFLYWKHFKTWSECTYTPAFRKTFGGWQNSNLS